MRRRFLRLLAGTAAALALPRGPVRAADDPSWATFKRRFVAGAGRVVDTGNDDVSHSESQGWGMLFAEGNDDRDTFQRLWKWTAASLQRPDGLFSWRWLPRGEPVPDKNNASDGDLLIAWALARAARRWDEPALATESVNIQNAVLEQLVVELQGRTILLPGLHGFQRRDFRVVNLSYYVWPALQDFADAAGESGGAAWRRLQADGLWLLDRAAFGTYHLPPDWLLFGDREPRIADGWPPHFGFDAVRIPLYLAWRNDAPRLERFLDTWRNPRFNGRPPAWINLRDGAVAPFPSSGGYGAIFALCQFVGGGFKIDRPVAGIVDADDYYSASLKLLSNLAAREASAAKRP